MDYCIGISRKNKEKNAGAKAPDDIIQICQNMGMEIFYIPAKIGNLNILEKIYWKVIIPCFYWTIFFFKVKSGDRIVFQHPLINNKIKKFFLRILFKVKSVNSIVLVHDLVSLRAFGTLSEEEKSDLLLFDKVICHNQSMRHYLQILGVPDEKLIVLGIFDYLTTQRRKVDSRRMNRIVVAGNLIPDKAGYLYEAGAKNPNVPFNLYGLGLDEEKLTMNMTYKGTFSPEDLIEHLEGDFGLVWDGPLTTACVGQMGEYLKYNNPHKASLFIVSELPIIIWNKAAISSFVLEHGIGIVVEQLDDLSDILANISSEEYQQMLTNIQVLSQKLREGYYTQQAVLQSWE